jgi:hypothetical protein
MNKCLVTKLNGSSNNTELLKLGEMRMKILKVQNPTEHTQGFSLEVNKPVTLEIISDGYFTDKTLTENKGKRITLNVGINSIWVNGNNDVEIAILDKYSFTKILNYYQGEVLSDIYGNNIKLNISDLKYSNALTYLSLSNTQTSGNIGDLKALTALTYLSLSNTQVSGNIGDLKALTALTNLSLFNTQTSSNIGDLKALTALTYLSLFNTQTSGNIGDLKALTALTYLSLSNTQVSGNIGDLKALTALTNLSLSNTQVPLTGDISELSVLSKCTEMSIKYSKLTGDLAILPVSCRFVSFQNDKGSVFTWSTRPSTAKIIAIEGNVSITNIDKMLQDQAQCQVGFSSNDSEWYKKISCVGTRTSASDAAVATLQSKGYTVSITPA